MTRGILFDLDETLVEFGRRRADARDALFDAGAARVYAFLTARGCALPPFEPFVSRQRRLARQMEWATRLTGGEPDARRLLRRLCRDFGLQRDEHALATLGWLWHQPAAEAAHLPDDVIPALSALRDGGVRLGLVVNTPLLGRVVDQHLENLGLLEFCPVRAYSTEIGSRKPDPRLFLAALDELGVAAEDAAFVGDDLKTDIVGAHRLGMTTILKTDSRDRAPRGMVDHTIERIGQLLELLEIVPRHGDHQPAPLEIPPLNISDVLQR